MNDNVLIPFEISESVNTLFTEMDPDIQVNLNTHYPLYIWCDHFIEGTFLTNISEKKSA